MNEPNTNPESTPENDPPESRAPRRISRGPWKTLWSRLLKNRLAVWGGLLLIFLYAVSCFAGFLSPYRYDDGDASTLLYGPMLFGSYTAELKEIFADETGREYSRYERTWKWFSGGVHFHDSEGSFSLRPHVHPLREYESFDEHLEREFLVAADPTVSVPIEFFVRGEQSHEIASLCGFFPVEGTLHLFGVKHPEGAAGSTRVYLLGSDTQGRDLLTRILYGGQISLSVGILGITLSMGIGIVIGGLSGYFGGIFDFFAMRLVELLMAIPGFYLILTLRAAIPRDLDSQTTYLIIVAILALAGWASTGRVVRGMVLSLKENEYSIAAKALGASHGRIIFKHVLPNTASFVIVTATLFVPYYILGEVALSFLGVGITEPETSWGLLLKDAQNSKILKYHPWLVIPGFFIFVAVLAFNFLGDGLRDAADPRAFISKGKKDE